MKPVKKISVLFILSFLVFCSCEKDPDVKPEILARAYVDLLVVEDYYSGSDSLMLRRNEVFAKYDMTEEIN